MIGAILNATFGSVTELLLFTLAIRKGNFNEFTKHLEGLSAIYQIDCDKYECWMFANVENLTTFLL